MAAPLLGGIQIAVLHQQGPWSYQTHLTLEHIDQLWQFIQGQTAQELTQACESLLVGEEVALLIPFIVHRAEFVDGEDAALVADTRLAEKDGRAHGEVDSQRDEGHQRGK